MKFHPFVSIPTVAILVCATSYPVLAQTEAASRIDSSTRVLQEFITNQEKRIPPAVIQEAQAIAIVPQLTQAGFILGGQRGAGVMLVRTPNGAWSNPIFITVTGGSIGAQIGAASRDVVLVFRTREAVENLLRDPTRFGGDVRAVAGPEGATAVTPVDQGGDAVYSYSRSQGLFAGVAISGVNLAYDQSLTAQFYNQPGITAREVFSGQTPFTPPVVVSLQQLLYQSGMVIR